MNHLEKIYIIIRTAYNQFEDLHSGIVKTTDKAGNTHQVEFDPLQPGAEDAACGRRSRRELRRPIA